METELFMHVKNILAKLEKTEGERALLQNSWTRSSCASHQRRERRIRKADSHAAGPFWRSVSCVNPSLSKGCGNPAYGRSILELHPHSMFRHYLEVASSPPPPCELHQRPSGAGRGQLACASNSIFSDWGSQKRATCQPPSCYVKRV